MIIDNSQSNVQIVGDIKEFKTSIDPKNLEFITTLLSSNLYSDPEQSFIREIVSNAWDSHVEAGTTDTPVIIRIKDKYSERSITIRDYGTGLSPERFKNIFCNIGSSTKRDSNEFIGAFGIGRYSTMACSNSAYITSYYNGTAYYYVMLKDGNSITTNLLRECPTEEKNGVEITIKDISSLAPYTKALPCIMFFPNIYIDGSIGQYINEIKIKRFKNFAVASRTVESKLLLGNVVDPCNSKLLSSKAQMLLADIKNTGIVVQFNIGELDITPNRESIIYNNKTISIIESRIEEVREEINKILADNISGDYDDLKLYSEVCEDNITYDFINNKTGETYDYGLYRFRIKSIPGIKVTYKGTDLSNYARSIGTLLRVTLPNLKCVVYNNKIHLKTNKWRVSERSVISWDKILVLNKNIRLTGYIQGFLKENYENYAVITETTLDEFKEYIKNDARSIINNIDKNNVDNILSEIYKYFYSRAKVLDIENDDKFIEYKEELKELNKKDKKVIKDIILYVWKAKDAAGYYSDYKHSRTFDTIEQAVNFIKKQKKGVIINNINNNQDFFLQIATIRSYMYIEARKDIVKYLRELNLSCVLDNDWLMYEDPNLSLVKTAFNIFPGYDKSVIAMIGHTIPEEELKVFKKVFNKLPLYTGFYYDIANRDTVSRDPYVARLMEKLRYYYRKYMEAKNVADENCCNTAFISAVIMKMKFYRISSSEYRRVKNNKLLNILCKK